MLHQLPSQIIQAPAAPVRGFTLGYQVASNGQQQYQQMDMSGYNSHELAKPYATSLPGAFLSIHHPYPNPFGVTASKDSFGCFHYSMPSMIHH
jgi:hypothetical protein